MSPPPKSPGGPSKPDLPHSPGNPYTYNGKYGNTAPTPSYVRLPTSRQKTTSPSGSGQNSTKSSIKTLLGISTTPKSSLVPSVGSRSGSKQPSFTLLPSLPSIPEPVAAGVSIAEEISHAVEDGNAADEVHRSKRDRRKGKDKGKGTETVRSNTSPQASLSAGSEISEGEDSSSQPPGPFFAGGHSRIESVATFNTVGTSIFDPDEGPGSEPDIPLSPIHSSTEAGDPRYWDILMLEIEELMRGAEGTMVPDSLPEEREGKDEAAGGDNLAATSLREEEARSPVVGPLHIPCSETESPPPPIPLRNPRRLEGRIGGSVEIDREGTHHRVFEEVEQEREHEKNITTTVPDSDYLSEETSSALKKAQEDIVRAAQTPAAGTALPGHHPLPHFRISPTQPTEVLYGEHIQTLRDAPAAAPASEQVTIRVPEQTGIRRTGSGRLYIVEGGKPKQKKNVLLRLFKR